MMKQTILLLVALVTLSLVHVNYASTGKLNTLTPDTFDDVINGDVPAFIKFYAPWCGHCKNMASDWKKLAEKMDPSKAIIAEVDCDKYSDLGSKFNIEGFPTLKWFPEGVTSSEGTPEDYQGPRTLAALEKFVNGNIGGSGGASASVTSADDEDEDDSDSAMPKAPKAFPEAVVHLDSDTFEDAISQGKHVLVEFYAPWCGHCKTLKPIYESAAQAFKSEPNVTFAAVDSTKNSELAQKYGVSGYPTIKYFGPDGEEATPYEGARTLEAFTDFINEKAGTMRTTLGEVGSTFGRIPDLDKLASQFMKASKTQQQKLYEQAKKWAKTSSDQSAAVYTKMMEKILENTDYVSKEAKRLAKLIKDGVTGKSIDHKKLDFMMTRSNILSAFTSTAGNVKDAAAEQAENVATKVKEQAGKAADAAAKGAEDIKAKAAKATKAAKSAAAKATEAVKDEL